MEEIKYSLQESADGTATEFEKALDSREIGKGGKGRGGRPNNTVKVMWVHSIDIQWPTLNEDDDNYGRFQITTNSEGDSFVNISDKDLFFQAYREAWGAQAAGANVIENIIRYEVNKPYIKDTMWLTLAVNNGAQSTLHICINFTYKYISKAQLSRIISRKV